MELTIEEVKSVVFIKFPVPKYIVKIEQIKKNTIKVNIYEKECNKPILTFEIIKLTYLFIEIDAINKCNINGNTIIKHIKFIGKELGCVTLRLEDQSTIYQIDNTKFTLYLYDILGEKCTIPLSYYKILLNGESWYNKYGFTSDEVEIEKPKWALLRKEQFMNVYLRYKNKNIEEFLSYSLYDKRTKRIKSMIGNKKYTKIMRNNMYQPSTNSTSENERTLMNLKKINQGSYDKSLVKKTTRKNNLLQKKMLLFLGENDISPFLSVKKVFELIDKKRQLLDDIEEAKKFYCELSNIIKIFENQIYYQNYLHYTIK
jgi:hypothetical protein